MGGGDYTRLTLHSTVAMNLVAGRRAHWDPASADPEGHVYILDLPAENRLVVTDENGQALPGARVEVYQDTSHTLYAEVYNGEPDIVRTADENGAVLLGSNPMGPLLLAYKPKKPIVSIVRVEHQGLVGYGFLPVADLNLEYWRGHEELGEYELAVTLREP